MNKDFERIPVLVPIELSARLKRIAQRRFSTSYRKLPTLGNEALSKFADDQERTLKLEPITPTEVEELAGSKEAVAA